MGVRSTKRENPFRRARTSRAVSGFVRLGREPSRPERRSAGGDGVTPTPRDRIELDPIQDVALYNCCCGLVFEAEVKTAVNCPQCGGEQAW